MNHTEHDLAAAKAYVESIGITGGWHPERQRMEDAYIAGLTAGRAADRRERIATAAMQGLLTGEELVSTGDIAREATEYADALIAKLDRMAQPASDAESRCKQWESMYGPILDFLQRHPEIVGAKLGDDLSAKLLAFLEAQKREAKHG